MVMPGDSGLTGKGRTGIIGTAVSRPQGILSSPEDRADGCRRWSVPGWNERRIRSGPPMLKPIGRPERF